MAHEIFGDRFLERESRRPAWHGLGTTLQEDEVMTVSEAMVNLDISYTIDQIPMFFRANNKYGFLEEYPTGKLVNVRSATFDSDPKVLGVVSNNYKLLQPTDLAKILDPVSRQHKLETIGSLKEGKGLFMTFKVEESKIAGEDHVLYWLVYDNFDGSGSMTMAFVPVRVVCQNTLNAALNSSKVSIDMPHKGQFAEDVDLFTRVFAQMGDVQGTVMDEMNAMANPNISLSNQQIDYILWQAYPDAPTPQGLTITGDIRSGDVDANTYAEVQERRNDLLLQKSKDQDQVNLRRSGALYAYNEFNDSFPRLARTPWAIYNAIVETEDFRKGLSPQGNMTTFIKGDRVSTKRKAYTAALEFVS